MLRATKFLAVCFFVTLALTNVGQAQAQSTYELGPFMAIGSGETASEAEADAYGEAWDITSAMAEAIPAGHVIIEFVVENGQLIDDTYFLEFHLVVEYDPNPPGGGGQGGEGA